MHDLDIQCSLDLPCKTSKVENCQARPLVASKGTIVRTKAMPRLTVSTCTTVDVKQVRNIKNM